MLICGYGLFALASPPRPGVLADPGGLPGIVERPVSPIKVVQHKPEAGEADSAQVN